jgi:hypothetical protein
VGARSSADRDDEGARVWVSLFVAALALVAAWLAGEGARELAEQDWWMAGP